MAHRTPDDAPVRQKMIYASSKDAIRKQLVGIATEIQATGYDEITKDSGRSFHQALSLSHRRSQTECRLSLISSHGQGYASLSGVELHRQYTDP